MAWEPPTYTAEEILANTEAHAAHWENEAPYSPADIAVHCLDYAQHLRVLAELFRLRLLDEAFEAASRGQVP
jgi:hypothetical protein